MLDPTLHTRIAAALGWTEADAKSMPLQALRELVRPVDGALAEEISRVVNADAHWTRGPETPDELLVSARANKCKACLTRARRGFSGACPACANDAARRSA